MVGNSKAASKEHRQLVALYEKLAEYAQIHLVDDIDKMVMDGTFGVNWPEIDASAPIASFPKWNDLKPADPFRVQWLEHSEVTSGEATSGFSLGDNLRKRLRKAKTISKAVAIQLAESIVDLTLNDGRIIASQAPVAALAGPETATKFQIPLAHYFQDVLHLSDEVVALWENATLSIQLRNDGMRLLLHSPPRGWALAVSLDRQSAMVLDANALSTKAEYIKPRFADHQMAIVPFEPRP